MRGAFAADGFQMSLPDLAPWFANVSDDYEELPAGESDTCYDE